MILYELMLLAMGSWVGTSPNSKELARASSWLSTALEAGYRHIDTAALYGMLENTHFFEPSV